MKRLLTIVTLFLCFVSKAQGQQTAYDFGLNVDFPDMQKILYMRDTARDNFLVERGWIFNGYSLDSDTYIGTTIYGLNLDVNGGMQFQVVIGTDSLDNGCYVAIIFMADNYLNSYLVNQAIKNGFKYKKTTKETSSMNKLYFAPTKHLYFVSCSESHVEGAVANEDKAANTQKFTNIISAQKYFERAKH